MGMCQTCDRANSRGLNENEMPNSVANRLPADMYNNGRNGTFMYDLGNPFQHYPGGKAPREIMEYKADMNDDFMGHNLKH